MKSNALDIRKQNILDQLPPIARKMVEKTAQMVMDLVDKGHDLLRITKLIPTPLRIAVFLIIGGIAEANSQTSDDPNVPVNKYNTFQVTADFNASYDAATEAKLHDIDVAFTESLQQNEDTQFFGHVTEYHYDANVDPGVYSSGNMADMSWDFFDWVNWMDEYANNGRPNTTDLWRLYAHYLETTSDAMGISRGGTPGIHAPITFYSSSALDPSQGSSYIVEQQEEYHAFGGSSNDGVDASMHTDIWEDGTYSGNNMIATAVTDYSGSLVTTTRSSNADKRMDIERVMVNGTPQYRVYGVAHGSGGSTVNFWTTPETLANTINGVTSLDYFYSRVKSGGVLENMVKHLNVPSGLSMQTKTPEVQIDGTTVTFNYADLATDNPYNGIPDKLMVFVYLKTANGIGQQIPRKMNGVSRPKLGFTITANDPSIDLSYFLSNNGNNTTYTMSQLDFRVLNIPQNACSNVASVVATPTVANCTNYTAYLDANGNVTIPEDAGNNGSTGDNLTFDSTPDTFDCSNVGDNTVTLEVTGDGGTDTCTYTVTVVDNTAPTLTTQNVAGFLDSNGNYTANPSDFVQSMNDACGIASVTLNNTNFDCNNLGGNNPVEVTVTDNNGNQTTQNATLTLNDNLAPTNPANFSIDTTTDTSVSVHSDTSVDNCQMAYYEFYIDTNTDGVANGTLVDTATTPNYTYTNLNDNTTYEFYSKAVDATGNTSDASNVVQTTTLGIEDEKIAGLRMYPNPATNILNIEIDGELDDIEIYNLQGQLVREFDPQGASKYPANISGLAKGVYIVDIYNKQGQKSVEKLVLK